MRLFDKLLFFSVCVILSGDCARILGVFPFAPKSHFILANSFMKILAEAGHDITIIACHQNDQAPSNGSYRTIFLRGFFEDYNEQITIYNLLELNDSDSVWHPHLVQNLNLDLEDKTLRNREVQKLLNSTETFDLVIVEKFYTDAILAFAQHFDAPLVVFHGIGPSPSINNMVGNPEPYAYVPYFISTFPTDMSFLQRMHNSFLYAFQEVLDYYYFLPQRDKLIKKYFPSSPSIYDIYTNVSLVFVNIHESYSQSVPLVPNIIPIGGFHLKKTKLLPQDLQTFLDDSAEGVVYLSLGSVLKSRDLSSDKRKEILSSLGKLKENVLMKWEEDSLPDQPRNVFVRKWLPQADLLAHPNIKLFITHGGLLGTTEAMNHGVPLLVIPVFFDQHSNAERVVQGEFGLKLPYADINLGEGKLSSILDELLNNSKYRENAKKRSKLFHDRPISAKQSIVYWVDYVIKHKGAHHLRVAGVQLPWYKYHLVDVIVFILALAIGNICIAYLCLRKISSWKRSKKIKGLTLII